MADNATTKTGEYIIQKSGGVFVIDATTYAALFS